MKSVSRKMLFTKLAVISAFAVLFGAVFLFSGKTEKTLASASGPSASHTNAQGEDNCTACHSSFAVNSGTGGVSITGIPANYLPNQQIPLTVRTSEAGATIYGFQLTAIDSTGKKVGTYTIPAQSPARLQLVDGFVGGNARQYIEHTVDGVVPAQFDYNTWTFQWTAPGSRVGKIRFFAAGNAANGDGRTSNDSIYTTNGASLSGTATANFDGDTKSDFSVWRPSDGVWYSLNTANNGFVGTQWGLSSDVLAPGDYDGDGKTDNAVFRPSNSIWYIKRSDGNGYLYTQFGLQGDIPVPGDYDGDLKTDIAVYRPSNGVWYIFRSSDSNYDVRQLGISGDKIAPGDYDADGKTDVAIYRPSSGDWYVWKSADNSISSFHFGIAEDKPVPADYDGDGKIDFAVFRPSSGTWYFQGSSAGFGAVQFGANGDTPVPTDYDGDGKTDFAVFRPMTSVWYVFRSSDFGYSIIKFGLEGDIPIASKYFAE